MIERSVQKQRWISLALFIIMVCACTPLFAGGRNAGRSIKAKWLDEPPVIDGALSEGVWQKAEIATNFFRAEGARGVPATLNTKAMVLYDANTLYVGVYCDEPNMNALRETQTRRDAPVWQDDMVQVLLDTYHDQRNCYVLAVNTLGTQMDAKIGNESNFDQAWDAKWDAKVKKNGNHWTAEMAIPFSELRFNPQTTTWGINFARSHPMEGTRYSWSDMGDDFSRVSAFGELANLDFSKVNTDRKIGILPYVTQRAVENEPSNTSTGVDLAIPFSTNITTNLTFNPDFSQLESDSTRINVSSNQELYLPERRPFFREGADLFELPLDLFYTRRVQEIDYGVKSTGKVGDYNFALIDTYGTMVDRYDDDQKKQANLFAARVNRNIGERTVIGVMGIQKHQSDRDVTLLSLDGRFPLHRNLTARSQYVMDWIDGEMHGAYHASMGWRHESGWGADVRVEEIQDGFRPNETGLEDEAFRKTFGRVRYRHQFDKGSLIRGFHASGYHLYKVNGQNLLWARRVGLSGGVDIGKFNLYTFGGTGVRREDGALYDRQYIGSDISYRPKWGRLSLFNRFGPRQNKFSRFTRISADVNLFGKLTFNMNASNFFWRENQNTFIVGVNVNYQFMRQMGWRIFVERIDERLENEVKYNFNSVFDYAFTPESRVFLVFADGTDGNRAVFTKMSYLFESDLLF
ncbi:MAG: DUF5916 domain-containing protein [Candidatus Poribacteria bacterium]|nr:DUF5916 domain-containing protein [Candidatus Poribacteria bacterium]